MMKSLGIPPVVGSVLLLFLPLVHAAHQPTYDLNKAPGSAADAPSIVVYGAALNDIAGNVCAGDLNDDGIDDLIVGASGADVGTPMRENAGAVYVWFGKGALAGTKDAAGTAGAPPDLIILGASSGDGLANAALVVGDVNGDDTPDLLLGAVGARGPADERLNGGEAYIIFGRKSPASFPAMLDLAVQGSGGADVTIYGATEGDQLTRGGALAVGDVSGDGIPDIILGASLADGPADGRTGSGEAYIIYGRPTASFPVTLDLSVQGSGGADVTFYAGTVDDRLTEGGDLAVGDVNGDGVPDLLLGALFADGPEDGRLNAGEAYIVYGRPAATFPATLDLAVQGSGGADVTIYGATAGDWLTQQGSLEVGDVNGDGTPDLLLGAPSADGPAEGRSSAGEAYIVYGRPGASFPSTLDLAVQGSGGANVTLYGASPVDQLTNVGALAVGDVNGDGTPDLLLGAPGARGPADGRLNAGEAYIVYGRPAASFPATLDLAVQGSGGANVTIYGATANDHLTENNGMVVGDMNGDGTPDLLLGAFLADGPANGRSAAGEAYIIYGRPAANFQAALDLAVQGSGGADVTIYGGQTNDRLTYARALAVGDVNGDGAADLLLGAYQADGPANSRSSAGEAYVLFGIPATPDIAVAQVGPVADGGSVDLGTVTVGGSSTAFTFTITNSGTADLTSLAVTKGGADAGEFSVSALSGTNIPSGAGTATFAVIFSPSSGGPKSASLQIASNVIGTKNPFDITVTGEALTLQEAWRLQYFGIATNTGNAADVADPDGDGQTNLFEYVAGLVPNDAGSRFLLRVEPVAGELGQKAIVFGPVLAGRTYAVKSRANLTAGVWEELTSFTASDAGNERMVIDLAAGTGARFYEVEIARP